MNNLTHFICTTHEGVLSSSISLPLIMLINQWKMHTLSHSMTLWHLMDWNIGYHQCALQQQAYYMYMAWQSFISAITDTSHCCSFACILFCSGKTGVSTWLCIHLPTPPPPPPRTIEINWASKETYHFFVVTFTEIHCIKMIHIWTQIR